MPDIIDQLERVETRQDLYEFVRILMRFVARQPRSTHDEIQNTDLVSYLEAMSGAIAGMDGAAMHAGRPWSETSPSWHDFARVLLSALYYD